MGLITELRNSLENPSVPLSFPVEWLTDFFEGGKTDSGLRISQRTALQIPVVFACVQIVSNGLASLPLNVVEVSQQAVTGRVQKTLAFDHDLQDILHTRPHPEMSSQTWRKVMMCYALLWANAYSEILLDNSGCIAALAPRAPWKTGAVRLRRDARIEGIDGEMVLYPKGTLCYKTTQGISDEDILNDNDVRDGYERLIAPERMVFIPGLTLDGRVGQDTVHLMRQCFGLALATEKFGAKFFGNGGRPGGILELLGSGSGSIGIKDEQLTKARDSFEQATGGENMHRVFVVKGGTKFTPISTPNNDAQFLETRKYQRDEVGAVFQVPGHMLGDAGGVTRSTAEQLGQEFISYTLGPWIPSWEQELKYKLFTLPNQRGRNAGRYEPQFNPHALLYPDADSKSKFYQSGKLSGWLSTNDIHEFENMNPVSPKDGGEDYWMPVNVSVIGAPPEAVEVPPLPAPEQPGEPPDPLASLKPKPEPPEKKSEPDFSGAIASALPMFTDAFQRYSKRNKPDLTDFQAVFGPVLAGLKDGIRSVAAKDLEVDSTSLPDTDKFITGYAAAMHKRATDFKVEDECKRATRAIAISVYQELVVSRVKGEAHA